MGAHHGLDGAQHQAEFDQEAAGLWPLLFQATGEGGDTR
jgi:hypothetical protein